jgi:hypothetical protein
MAMLDRQGIPEHLLRRQDESDFEFLKAARVLDSLSLITKEAEKESFAIHRLVQLSVHSWLEHQSQLTHYEEEAIALVADKFPNSEYENRELCQGLLPHARLVLRYDTATQRLNLLHNVSWFDSELGRYN